MLEHPGNPSPVSPMQKLIGNGNGDDGIRATPNTQPLARSYIILRRCIGIIAIALPVVLLVGSIFLVKPGILDSISAYYYSGMRDIFVGTICAIGVFLLFYRYKRWDDIVTDFAGAFAIGVALFPTAPDVGATPQQVIIGRFHWLFGICFFVSLAFIALFFFRKTDQKQKPTRKKQHRNMVYSCCGSVIVLCIVLCGIIQIFLPDIPARHPMATFIPFGLLV